MLCMLLFIYLYMLWLPPYLYRSNGKLIKYEYKCWKSSRLYKYLPMITTSALSGTSTVADRSRATVGCFTFCNLLQLASICNDRICNNTVQWVPRKTAFQTIKIFGGVRWICTVTTDRERRQVLTILCLYC